MPAVAIKHNASKRRAGSSNAATIAGQSSETTTAHKAAVRNVNQKPDRSSGKRDRNRSQQAEAAPRTTMPPSPASSSLMWTPSWEAVPRTNRSLNSPHAPKGNATAVAGAGPANSIGPRAGFLP